MKKYFYFAVQRIKDVQDGTGRSRKQPVLVYGTKCFSSAKECDEAYASYRQTHPEELSCIRGFEKPIIIDTVTHEFKGVQKGEQ